MEAREQAFYFMQAVMSLEVPFFKEIMFEMKIAEGITWF